MSSITFQKATKRQLPARIALDGPTGAGKTWSGLVLATELGKRICWIDTERRSASLYADHYEFDTFQFDPPYDPGRLVDVIRAAEDEGYDVIGIDSLSHFWEGEGGTLDIVDGAARSQFGGNKYAGWSVATPQLRRLVDTMLGVGCHLIVTMRSKMEYLETTKPNGQKTYEKVGMAPIMRGGIEYEFTLVGDMDLSHTLHVSKSRCDVVTDKTYQPGAAGDLAKEFKAWLDDGEPIATAEQIARIKAVVMAAPDAESVKAVGNAWGERFGPVNQLLASRFEEGLAFAQELIAKYRPAVTEGGFGFGESGTEPGPTPGDESPTSDSETSEAGQPDQAPSGEPRGPLLIRLEQTISGLPTARQVAARKAMAEQFGDPDTLDASTLTAAIEWIKAQPVATEGRSAEEIMATTDPAAGGPALSAKQRELVAYGRKAGLDARQLMALASMTQGTAEPRPLHELNQGACLEVKALVDRVADNEIVFETPAGVLIAKEKTPA